LQPGWRAVLLAAAAIAIVGVLVVFDPHGAPSVLPPCPFHALTGLFCPGCGTTRALHALLHGNLGLAVRMNALTVAAIPAIALMAWNTRFPGRMRLPRLSDARPWLVVVVTFAVLRNLPWVPFVWLAPG
jgi:hypothetical protein